MSTIVHLSDTHLSQETGAQALDSLGAGLRRAEIPTPDAIVVTGDLFDTVSTDKRVVADLTRRFVDTVRGALESPTVPIVLVPGNHDRRCIGAVGCNSCRLWNKVRSLNLPNVLVYGCDPRKLAEVVPLGLPGWLVVAHDSTYLPRALFSSGGTVRAEDLLKIARLIEDESKDIPLLWITHHHLVPTPVTDLGRIGEDKPIVQRFLSPVLRRAIAYGDREEIFMTAMGAGSGLSMLHALGRPVVVLHGHKHYPTVRLLKATVAKEGDVAIVSAGSAGTREAWHETESKQPMHLWPSFSVVTIDKLSVAVDTVAFPPDPGSTRPINRRRLVTLQRQEEAWSVLHPDGPTVVSDLLLNSGHYKLALRQNDEEYDLEAERKIEPGPGAPMTVIRETIKGLPGGMIESQGHAFPLPHDLELPMGTTRYQVQRAVCATLRRSTEAFGPDNACSWVSMPNRYGSDEASLTLEAPESVIKESFGSKIDLTTGSEVPLPFDAVSSTTVTLTLKPCPPRTILRIYWTL